MPKALNTTAERDAEHLAALAQVGIRSMPFPFSGAVAIVSDLDASTRARYDAYVTQLVHRLGLDFGDSTWLRWQSELASGERGGSAAGFFSSGYGDGRDELAKFYGSVRTQIENLAEYHAGNVDHFHAFLPRGPRVVLLERAEPVRAGAQFLIGELQLSGERGCRDFPVTALRLDLAESCPPPRRVCLELADGSSLDLVERGGLFVIDRDSGVRPPSLTAVQVVAIEGVDPHCIRRLLLVEAYSELLFDLLALLRQRFHVDMALITEHSGVHFRSKGRAETQDRRLVEAMLLQPAQRQALNGTVHDADGNLVFSTDADVPESLARMFPEVVRDLGVRFIVPVAAGRGTGWQPMDVVVPLQTRTGGSVYQARRMMPVIAPAAEVAHLNIGRTWQDTFALRLKDVLDQSVERPGLFWPIYTHLGAVPRTDRTMVDSDTADTMTSERALPDPYLDERILGELTSRVFGGETGKPRLWLTRASVLYDYALMLRSIAPNVLRRGADRIDISSWHDPVIDRRLPVSAAQLYGLTFHVGSAADAVVRLDGNRIETLIRNPADDTGRESVTIAACDLRAVLFDQLDPMRNAPTALCEGGRWSWKDAQRGSFGRIHIGQTGRAELSLPLHGWTLPGAQLLSYALRCETGVSAGILLETDAGAKFYFGDAGLLEELPGQIAATYLFERQGAAPGRWSTWVAPFHDLRWSAAAPGEDMPNHPLRTMTMLVRGPQGARADFARVGLMRPRASGLSRDGEACVIGTVPSFEEGQRVFLAPDGPGETRETLVDQRGWFCFAKVPHGIVRIWTVAGAGELVDRRGPLVEVDSDQSLLRLDRLVA